MLKCQYETWEELFVQTQLPHLLECGFKESDIGFEVVPAAPTSDCEYYSHDTALLPIMTKPAAPPQPPLPTTGVVRAKRASPHRPPRPHVCAQRTGLATGLHNHA